jgi:hypothetical protein
MVLVAALALPGVALAQDGQPGDQIVFGDNYILASGESVGNLTVLGGNVELQEGSTVIDNLVVLGGNIVVKGAVQQDIVMYGGQLTLDDSAVISGDVSLMGGNLSQTDGALVSGSVSRMTNIPFLNLPRGPVVTVPRYFPDFDPLFNQIIWFMAQTLGLTALAMLVILFAPKVTERAGNAALARPIAAGGLGLLVAILTPVLVIGFAITIIGLPITLLLVVAAGILLTFGWIALGLEVGKRLAQAFHQTWPAVVSAGLGTLLLSVVANGIGLAPCIGWVVPTLVGFVGMGGVLLSRLGTAVYPASTPATPVTPVA